MDVMDVMDGAGASAVRVERKKIFLVDDNPTNLTAGKSILKGSYKVYTVPSAKAMFDLLEDLRPDLILLDIEMPEMDGYEAIAVLKSDPTFANIPVIFLTARADAGSEAHGLALGAVDYIYKPFLEPHLMERIGKVLS
jgi:putative two-component system response regulator